MAGYLTRLRKQWWDYRQRRRRRVTNLTGKNYRIARRMLLDAVDACNDAGVDYALDGGTLLGLVRDGDLIPWDKDVDLTLDSASVEQFKTAYPRLRACGWRIDDHYTMPYDDLAWRAGDIRSIKVRNQWFGRFGRGRIVLDIFIRYRHDGGHWWAHRGHVNRAEGKFFDNYRELEFGGRRIRAPDHCEDYLDIVFGNWRTPDRSYNGSVDDGTIVGDLGRNLGG